MEDDTDSADAKNSYRVGPGNPPIKSRFKKGRSGNPAGRPKRPPLPHAIFWEELQKDTSVKSAGELLTVSRLEAMVLRLGEMSRQGEPKAVRLFGHVVRKFRRQRASSYGEPKDDIPKWQWTEEHERLWLLAQAEADEIDDDDDDEEKGPPPAAP